MKITSTIIMEGQGQKVTKIASVELPDDALSQPEGSAEKPPTLKELSQELFEAVKTYR